MDAERYKITNLRWGVMPYTRGGGLHVGSGPNRLFPNGLTAEAAAGPEVDLKMQLDKLRIVADGAFDWIFLADVLQRVPKPRALLADAWRALAVGGYLILCRPTPVAAEWILAAGSPYPDFVHHVTLEMGPQRIDVFEKLTAGEGRHAVPRIEAEKTCAIVRPGGYGDALWASSILPALKDDGYHITVYTEDLGAQVLQHDPNVDQIVVTDESRLSNPEFGPFWMHEAKRYGRFINLVESVEKNLIAIPTDLRFFWPAEQRRRALGRNYLEAVHELAGVPKKFAQRFYATDEEKAQAFSRHIAGRKSAVYAITGSTLPKYWPHTVELCRGLIARGYDVWIVGELRDFNLAAHANVHVVGITWSIRETLTFAQQADLVVGQETGVLNAVAQEGMRKVVLLSHSGATQLTKHWANTVAVHGSAPCWPCHQVHYNQFGFRHCTQDPVTKGAACQATISPEAVLEAVDRKYVIRAAA